MIYVYVQSGKCNNYNNLSDKIEYHQVLYDYL